MLIAGAGGHAKEVLDVLLENKIDKKSIYFFDDIISEPDTFLGEFQLLHTKSQIYECLGDEFQFCLGVGNPEIRKILYEKLNKIGGRYVGINSKSSFRSSKLTCKEFDSMMFAFISSTAEISEGVLVNAGAKIHHDVKIGRFSEISPSSVILGGAKVGDFCRIGSNSTILPGVEIGNNVIVGAGAVVTKNFTGPCLIHGVPARHSKS